MFPRTLEFGSTLTHKAYTVIVVFRGNGNCVEKWSVDLLFFIPKQSVFKGGFPMNAVRLALWLSYLLHNIQESWRNYFRTTVDISPSFWCFCVYSIKNFLRSQLFRKFTLSSRLIFAEINSVYQLDWYIKRLENTEMCLCGSSILFDRIPLCLPVKSLELRF